MRTIATIGASLLALGIASAALAIEPPAGGGNTPPQQGGDKPAEKPGDKGGKGAGKRPDFKTLDKNGDGFITSDEVPAEAWERMKKADKNGDGKVSEAEMKEARPPRGPGGKGQGGGQGGGDPPAKKPDAPQG